MSQIYDLKLKKWKKIKSRIYKELTSFWNWSVRVGVIRAELREDASEVFAVEDGDKEYECE